MESEKLKKGGESMVQGAGLLKKGGREEGGSLHFSYLKGLVRKKKAGGELLAIDDQKK